MPEWLKGADCKSVDNVYDGSNPSSPTISFEAWAWFHLWNVSEVERSETTCEGKRIFSKNSSNQDEKSFY